MSNLVPPDGAHVSCIAQGEDFGQHGQLLTTMGRAGHVKWATGPKTGRVTMVETDDLIPHRSSRIAARDELDDSLDVGTIAVTGVREVQDTEGTVGVLNMLASTGRLDGLTEIAQDALDTVIARMRQHPGMREVCAQLDEDEGEELVQLTSQALLRDVFGDADE